MELVSPSFMTGIVIAAMVGGFAIGIWWIISLYGVHSRKSEKELPEVELPGHIHEVMSGIPVAVAIFYAFILVSLIVYVLYIWLGGLTY